MRQVKPGERCLKKVTGVYNDSSKYAELYGFWQTEEFSNKLTVIGGLPRVILLKAKM